MARTSPASTRDNLVSAIEAIYAAGFDQAQWPNALGTVAKALNGHGATFEVFDWRAVRHRAYHAFQVPTATELAYMAHHIAGNPRWIVNQAHRTGDLGWDYQFIDENGMDRAPFYAELLAALKWRYFISGVMHGTPDDVAFVSVQFSSKQGHAQKPEIRQMKVLLPHLQRAFDMSQRLIGASSAAQSFERAFDWVDDGVAIITSTGSVIYTNPALHDLVRRADVVRLQNGVLEFLSVDARAKFDAALGAVHRLKHGGIAYEKPTDFTVARAPDQPRCLVSVRPLSNRDHGGEVLVLIRDPLARSRTPGAILRDSFGLTVAECDLALAVQSRQRIHDYARTRGVTLNTVYSQLRRIREKTGSHSIADLIERLEALRPPLRPTAE